MTSLKGWVDEVNGFTIDTALASLTGTITERKPETALDANLLRLRLVAEAKDAASRGRLSAGLSEYPARKPSGGQRRWRGKRSGCCW